MIEIKYVSINSIKPDPTNPRTINEDQFNKLKKSIQDNPSFLEVRPILVDKDNIIFAGNMRYRAALELGLQEVPVAIMDLTPEKREELMLRDNVTNGEWNPDQMVNFAPELLKEIGLDNLGKWGFPDEKKEEVEYEYCESCHQKLRKKK